jgi:hypothetical protein
VAIIATAIAAVVAAIVATVATVVAAVIVTAISAVVVTAISAVVAAVVAAAITAVIATVVVWLAMAFLIMRNIFMLIPVVLHKIDALVAGVVLAAMPAPVLRVVWRYVQVDRRAVQRCPIHDARLRIDQLRPREIADVDMTVETGLTDAERYADIGAKNRGSDSKCCRK